jgi:PAS domain S-box-containing protein
VRVDITDLKQREASFRLLFDGNPLPMYVFDVETLGFMAVNDAAISHYGYSREQFRTMTILDIRPPEDGERFKAALPTFDTFYVAEGLRHKKSTGAIFEADVYSRAMTYHGRAARFAAVLDVTENNKARRALLENKGRTCCHRPQSTHRLGVQWVRQGFDTEDRGGRSIAAVTKDGGGR